MALQHSPSIVTDGLVLCLDAANPKSYPGSGTAWTDLSGLSNTGTLTNGPTYNSANGGSIVLDQVDDFVQIPSPFGDTNWGTRAWTISFWMKNTMPSSGGLITLNTSTSTNYGVNTYWQSGLGIYFYFVLNSPSTQFVYNSTSSTTMSTDETLNFVMSYNGNGVSSSSNMAMYKNGTALTVSTGGAILLTNQAGIQLGGTNYKFKGNIYSFSMYNRALTATEVSQNFNALRGRFGL